MTENRICSVRYCGKLADYAVYLYDLYAFPEPREFFELDFTCPYLCEKHKQENEEKAEGERVPRGCVRYPYSNQNIAQGYTEYRRLEDQS